MSNEDYIASGVLELYVAGALDDKTAQEVTRMLKKHTELKDEVLNIEKAYIKLAELHAPGKAASFNKRIVQGLSGGSEAVKVKTIIPTWIKTALAASLVLLAASVGFNLHQKQNLDDTKTKLESLRSQNSDIANDFEVEKANYSTIKDHLDFIRNPETQAIALKGTDKAPEAAVVVYWDAQSQRTLVDAGNLPEAPPGKAYQLWSLSSMDPLTPHDAGMLVSNSGNQNKLYPTKNVNKAVAFAITLEPSGGSKSPTLEQLFVLGTIE